LGVVKDAFNKETDEFISVMLYEIDSAYTDTIISTKPPNYITNTQDSTTIFRLQNLKAGKYRLLAIKDEGKNNLYDAVTDKIGFVEDTISLPTDSIYLLNLFREVPKYSPSTPKFSAANKIIFGYKGSDESLQINTITPIPDSISHFVAKEPGKDTLNYWFTPFEVDSLLFEVQNERLQKRDTFTVKTRKLPPDSLVLNPTFRSSIGFLDTMALSANIPIRQIDTSRASMMNKDSISQPLKMRLDTLANRMEFSFKKEPNETYSLSILPGALTDLFGATNDTLLYKLRTGSYADYGNLRIRLQGAVSYPIILQLTESNGKVVRTFISEEDALYEFNLLEPKKYLLRVIFDVNANNRWDTGNFLDKIQPEKVVYFPSEIEVRANWELEQIFLIEE